MRNLPFVVLFILVQFSCVEEEDGANASSNHDLTAKVIYLKDGDSFVVLDQNKEEVEVRMIDIDAPELYQAHGKKAKLFLSDLIKGKRVGLDYDKKDKFGRLLATVYLDTIDVNFAMVEAGYAWRYKYSKDKEIAAAEEKAHADRIGLWQDKNPEKPWNWRRHHKR